MPSGRMGSYLARRQRRSRNRQALRRAIDGDWGSRHVVAEYQGTWLMAVIDQRNAISDQRRPNMLGKTGASATVPPDMPAAANRSQQQRLAVRLPATDANRSAG